MPKEDIVTVEGRWAVEALLNSPRFSTREVVFEQGSHEDLRSRLQDGRLRDDRLRDEIIPFRELSKEQIEQETGFDFHRGVFAIADRPAALVPDELFLRGATRLVALSGLADPGNLGTILRSAAAFGVDGILIEAGKGADVYNRKCIRASARAVFQLPIFEVPSLSSWVGNLKKGGFVSYATSPGEGAVSLPQIKPAEKSLLLLGEERDGLSLELQASCDETVRIPMQAGMDSLNVAACAAIVLYEFFGRGRSD